MTNNFFVNERKQNKIEFLEFINANLDKPMKVIIGLFSLRTGLRSSTIEIYLKELKDANLIIDKKEQDLTPTVVKQNNKKEIPI